MSISFPHPRAGTRLAAAVLAASLAAFAAAAAAAPLATVLPTGFDNMAGNAQGPAPFRFTGITGGIGGSHSQVLYEAGLFGNFDGPRLITGLDLRAFPGFAPSALFGNSITASNVIITLSTTARTDEGPNVLSATFADNVGADAKVVFAGPLTLTTAATGTTPVNPFDYSIDLQSGFVFDPSAGNLLLDVLIPSDATLTANGAFGFITFDTVNTLNDGVYSVFNGNSGSATSGNAGTSGPIIRVRSEAVAVAVPEPSTLALFGLALFGVGLLGRRQGVAHRI